MRTFFLASFVLTLFVLIFSPGRAFSQSGAEFSIETDPATFFFKGYAVHLRLKPAGMDHWLFGVGTYAMDMPDPLIDLNEKNKGEGWKLRIDQGYGLFAEYYLSESNKGLFIGEQLGLQKFLLTREGFEEQQLGFSNLLFMTYAGFSWRPFKNGLYIKPWGGLGLSKKLNGSYDIGNEEYDVALLLPFLTLHVGYTF